MSHFRGAQREIALLASCLLAAGCALDNRPSRVELPLDENAGGADPAAGKADTLNGAGAAGSMAPGVSEPGGGSASNGGETAIAPALPPPGGAGGSSGNAAGSTEPSEPGQGTAGSGTPSGGVAGMGAPPPVTEPEVIGGCFNQLLRNGDFERGRDGWTEVSELRDVIVWRGHPDLAPTGVTPEAGNYLAWLGGIPNGDFRGYPTRLQQEVEIPAEVQSLTFSGYLWASQPELGRMPGMFDWAILELPDPEPTSSYLWRVQYFEDTVTEGWTYFEVTQTDVVRYAGRTVTVQAFSVPNGNGTQSVWLDSLRLEARCPR